MMKIKQKLGYMNRGLVAGLALAIGLCLAGNAAHAAENVLEFDGSDRVFIEEAELFQQNFEEMSLEFWVKPDEIFSDHTMVMHRQDTGDDNIGGSAWYAGFDGSGNLVVTFNARASGQNWDDGQTSVKPAAGEWHHVAGTWDGAKGYVYLDGDLIKEYNSSPMSNNGEGGLALGGTWFGGSTYRTFEGRLSDVRLWDVKLSQAEIQEAMNSRLTGTEPGLIGYWPINENEGDTAFDWTANDNHGDIDGAAWVTDADLTLLMPDADFLFALPFTLADKQTASTEFTNSNAVDIVEFPIPDGYDRFQITEDGGIESLGDWSSTNDVPGSIDFTQPTSADPYTSTNITLYAWFTNSTESVELRRAEGSIFYTEVLPDVAVHATHTRQRLPGESVTIIPGEIDDGSTGGEANGAIMPIHAMSLNIVSGDDTDAAPNEPYITVSNLGEYTLSLTVTNVAGNVATSTATCTLTVKEYSGLFTWTGAGDGSDWHDPYNWSVIAVPVAGEPVIIDGGASVSLTNSTAALDSLTLDNATLTVSNWMTRVEADTVTIGEGATVSPAGPFFETDMSNRVWIVCNDFTLAAGAYIQANNLGYSGGNNTVPKGQGIGGTAGTTSPSKTASGGAGHGGTGGTSGDNRAGGIVYGCVFIPEAPGSGSGNTRYARGRHGGGAILIEATGTAVINGVITADGMDGVTGAFSSDAGASSGGSILLAAGRLSGGATAELSARGGDGNRKAGGGGGGRIAVWLGTTRTQREFVAQNPETDILLTSSTHPHFHGALDADSVAGGEEGNDNGESGEPGTFAFYRIQNGTLFMVR